MRAALGLVAGRRRARSRVLGRPVDARQCRDRLHAAEPRRDRRAAAHRLGRRRQRGDRRAASASPGSTRRRGARSTGRSTRSARATSRAARSANSRAASASALLLSQALLGRPRLLLLDEPLISLDPAHQKGVVEIARRLLRRTQDRDPVQRARAQPAGQRASTACSISAAARRCSARSTRWSPARCCRGSTAPRSRWCASGTAIFVMAGDVEVERDAHRHDDGMATRMATTTTRHA